MKPAARRRLLLLVALALVAAAAAVILWLPPPGQGPRSRPSRSPTSGVRSCEECHAEETRRWRGSHHDLAMQKADERTVLGDFARRALRPRRPRPRASSARTGGYFVRTDGPDGRPADFPVAYVFGLVPLQQYLVELPGGRYQALVRRLGQPAEGGGRAALVPPLPGRACRPPGRAPLDEARRRTGTPSARSATRRTCARATASPRTASRRPSPRSTSPARRATARARATSSGRSEAKARGAGAEGGAGPHRPLHRAAQPRVGDGRGARDREADEVPRDALRGGDLRPLPRAARAPDRGVPAGEAARGDAPPGAPRRGALLRGRADAGRGLQLGLVPPEPDVREGRHLLGLPRRRTT